MARQDADGSDFWSIEDEPFTPPVRDALSDEGIEACAFYAPISRYGREHWGIYFIEDRMAAFAETLADSDEIRRHGYSLAKRFTVAAELYKWVDRHEQFHAATELFSLTATAFALRAEKSMGQHVAHQFGTYQQPKRHHFLDYFDHSYWKNFPNSECIEESLAQAFQFSLRSKVAGFRDALIIATAEMPDCYRDWKRFSGEN